MSKLSVLAPQKITDALFVSSTETENDAEAPAWDGAIAYAVGNRVRRNHVVYQCVRTSTNQDPANVIYSLGDEAYWTKVKPTNKWACVDDEVGTSTVATSDTLSMTFAPDYFTAIALLAIDADWLTVRIFDPETQETMFLYDAPLESSQPDDYWEHFYDPFVTQTEWIQSDIPPYYSVHVTVTMSKAASHPSLGMLAIGDIKFLGVTQYGAKVSAKSYSYVDTNQFGEKQIVRGKKATDIAVTARIKTEETPAALKILQDLMDVPCVWWGSDLPNYSLRTFGLGNGSITYDNFSDALLTLNIEGMI